MDAVPELVVTQKPRRWRPTVTPAIEVAVLLIALVIASATYFVVTRNPESAALLPPVLVAALQIANLIPAIALLLLIARRIAKRRAAKTSTEGEGGGRLHVRLVAIFLLLASIPIVFTVITASVMFHNGVQYWVSDRAKGAFQDAMDLVRDSQDQIVGRWIREGDTMVADLELQAPYLKVGSPMFRAYFEKNAFFRNFKQAVLFTYTPDAGLNVVNAWQAADLPDPSVDHMLKVVFVSRVTPKLLDTLGPKKRYAVGLDKDMVWQVYKVEGIQDSYLYVGSVSDAEFLQRQVTEGRGVLDDYATVQKRARSSQLSFNAALFGVALLIMILTMWIALAVADRLVRPLNLLVAATRRVAEGDLTARVPEQPTRDEVATLGETFNSMTERLQGQTTALINANADAESRRALIEAVMSGVSAGVLSIDGERNVRLINASASELLHHSPESAVGRPLSEVAPDLAALLDGEAREAVVQITVAGEARTLAVKITRDEGGQVLTFDDITQQLLDQRRAAWSDVARRIAHEIKNPLTPIQLSAERLKRRYGKQINQDDRAVFDQCTDTIVRQVGDLRRIVDEFSSFARMPKPLFRLESLLDIARQSMFLHEVAHPAIKFEMDASDPTPIVCDRRQIGQALTNVVKNAVEAVEAREEGKKKLPKGEIVLSLRQEDRRVVLTVADNGIGLPVERDRIAEPYMTTRARGTGLGLAIVKKIIEEHFGTIAFTDRKGGGTVVTICLDTEQLAGMASDAGPGDDAEPRPAALTRTGSKA